MSASFDLIEREWVPCILADGSREEFGLLKALVKAHEIREIHDASPLVTVALHRLLLAILHRNFGPENPTKWRGLWKAASFDQDALQGYFGKWRPRFDLFGEYYRFYQDPKLGRKLTGDGTRADKWRSPIPKLFHELASGNNPTLFDHTPKEPENGVPAAFAARGLVALQAYALSGIASGEAEDGKSHPSQAPLVRGMVHLVRGATLFETLMLNLVTYNPADNSPIVCSGCDAPAWEQKPDKLWEPRRPRGYLDFLTWQSRRVWLFPDDRGERVTGIAITEGNNFAKDSDLRDPQMIHDKAEKARKGEPPWPARKNRPQRAMWRDIDALLQSVEGQRTRPKVIDHVAQMLRDPEEPPRRLAVDTFGLANYEKAGKVNFWRHERLPLPAEYLQDDSVVGALQDCLRIAERRASAIHAAVRVMAREIEAPGKSNQDLERPENRKLRERVQKRANTYAAESVYWASLEVPFKELVLRLPAAVERGTSEDKEIPDWLSLVSRRATEALDQTIRGLGLSPTNMRAAVRALENLQEQLAKARR